MGVRVKTIITNNWNMLLGKEWVLEPKQWGFLKWNGCQCERAGGKS